MLAPRRQRPPMPRNAETRLLVIGCNVVEHNDDLDDDHNDDHDDDHNDDDDDEDDNMDDDYNLGGKEEAVQQSPNPVPVKNAAH